MESTVEDEKKKMIEEPLLGTQKGGFRTMPFIIANQAFERLASFGLMPNMILYLMNEYHLDMPTGSNILFFWSAGTNFTPVIGAFIADSTVGRFAMIGFGSIVTLMGMILLWLTSVIPQARPPPCDQSNSNCAPPTTPQLLFLFLAYALMSIGAGGIRASSLAFGADQLEQHDNHLNNIRARESYFSWYYVSAAFSVLIAMSCIVYIQENMGWGVGFGIPVVLMFFSALSFFLASPFYVKLKPSSSLLTGFAQVSVASYRKRHIKLSSKSKDVVYHSEKGSTSIFPSEKLRFLNKACVCDPNQELMSDGRASDPWSLCTIDQVEELKALIKVVPLWSTGIIINVTMSQSAFPVLQATSMDRHLTSNFEIPAASFSIFIVISLTIWIALYDRLILPLASNLMGKPVRISPKRRMGIGLFLSFVTMLITAFVESVRRMNAISKGYLEDDVAKMSALWLVPQNCLSGLAEAFNAIGQNEFYFSEFPRSMSSVASTLIGLGMSAGNLVASFIMSTIDDLTGKDGNESWVSSDINKGHYDYYFLVLAALSLLNVLYFLICDRAYGSSTKVEQEARGSDKVDVNREI